MMGRQKPPVEINLTPLVDIMLTVLALFMITSPQLLLGPEVELPAAPAEVSAIGDRDLVLTVTRDGRAIYREEDVTGRVTAALSRDPVLQEASTLYVRGDRETHYGLISEAMTDARAAAIRQLNLVIEPVFWPESAASGSTAPGSTAPPSER